MCIYVCKPHLGKIIRNACPSGMVLHGSGMDQSDISILHAPQQPYTMHRADTKPDVGRNLFRLVKIAKPQTRKTQPSKTNVSRRCDTTETWPRQLTKCCQCGGRNPTCPGVHRLISYAGNFFIISSSSSLLNRWNSRSGVTVATCIHTRNH